MTLFDNIEPGGQLAADPSSAPEVCTVEIRGREFPWWRKAEAVLDARGSPMPLCHRSAWLQEMNTQQLWLAVARDTRNREILTALPIILSKPRALVHHFRLRIEHAHGDPRGLNAILQELARRVRARSQLVSLNVELFTPDRAHNLAVERALRELGFAPAPAPRRYHVTAGVDLQPPESEIQRTFTASCRRFIRNWTRKGCQLAVLTEPRWAPRMTELWHETFLRTGAAPPERDWERHLGFAKRHPDLYRIVGVVTIEGTLLAFTTAMHNGTHAVYADGASTRTGAPGAGLTYAPMWDLIRWAKARGCMWFDLGGLSHGSRADADPRGGIADFKRRFSKEVIEVGHEWEIKPRRLRTSALEAVAGSAALLRRLVK